MLCPLCRTPVDKENVVKKILQIEAPTNMKVQDAFALNADNKVGPGEGGKVIDNLANAENSQA